MSSIRNLVCFFLFIGLLFTLSHAAAIQIRNQCPYTVWAATLLTSDPKPMSLPGGGRQLTSGQSWTINFNAGMSGRIWGRTNCTFDGTGHGRCQTGDCLGVLQCQAAGSPPCTLAEFGMNRLNNMDFYDMSLVDGFNIPMEFSPTTGGCRSLGCTADITGQCPNELRAPGGCNNPCTVFRTNEFCCTSGRENCKPTNFSMFFKGRCPYFAYTYPFDDLYSTFNCTAGGNYRVVFCPQTIYS